MLNAEKLKKIKEFIELSRSSLTEEEFVSAFKKVLDYLKRMEQKLNLEIEMLENKYIKIVNSIKANYGSDIKEIKKETKDYCQKEVSDIIKKVNAKMAEVKDGVNGLNADVDEVARMASEIARGEVLPLIPKIEDIEKDLPKLGVAMRDGLELLKGDDRLEISAIKDLKKELEEIRELKGKLGGGGGTSYIGISQHFVDDETPSGAINGTNKDFVLANTPNPTASLKVFRGGARQRITEDYTFSGRTISFITALVAGEIILCDYRK